MKFCAITAAILLSASAVSAATIRNPTVDSSRIASLSDEEERTNIINHANVLLDQNYPVRDVNAYIDRFVDFYQSQHAYEQQTGTGKAAHQKETIVNDNQVNVPDNSGHSAHELEAQPAAPVDGAVPAPVDAGTFPAPTPVVDSSAADVNASPNANANVNAPVNANPNGAVGGATTREKALGSMTGVGLDTKKTASSRSGSKASSTSTHSHSLRTNSTSTTSVTSASSSASVTKTKAAFAPGDDGSNKASSGVRLVAFCQSFFVIGAMSVLFL